MKKLTLPILITAILVSVCALTGCNTFKGMGQDVEALGESMQNAGD